MINTYYIGGSPCSGKSTVTELIAEKFDLCYFKVDDFLDRYTALGTLKNYEICRKQKELTTEQIWMREPELQCKEELQFYEEIFEFVLQDLMVSTGKSGIITEGAAYLPSLMKGRNVPENRYLSITPTKEFQIFHYKQREWVPYVLEGCSNKEKAFENWMERDVLFAKEVRKQCEQEQYMSIVNDGTYSIEQLADIVAKHFGLEA